MLINSKDKYIFLLVFKINYTEYKMDKKVLTGRMIAINDDLEKVKQILNTEGYSDVTELIQEAIFNLSAAAEIFNMTESEEF